MSYIVPRDKPQGCRKCPYINQYNDCRLIRGSERIETVEEQYQHCPLIEVPTPHGRLGDLDELEKQFKRAIGTYLPKDPTRHMDIVNGSECRGWTQALTAVQEAKTVIEAEE